MKRKGSAYPLALIALFHVILSTGCLSFNTSAKGIEASAYDVRNRGYEIIDRSSGESSSFRLFWVFPVTPAYDVREALDEAIAMKGGDNLIEVEYYYEKQLWILGTVEIVSVSGKVIRYSD